MTSATYYAKHKLLNYWQPNGTLMYVWCDSIEDAKLLVHDLPVKQCIQNNMTGHMYEVTENIKLLHGKVW